MNFKIGTFLASGDPRPSQVIFCFVFANGNEWRECCRKSITKQNKTSGMDLQTLFANFIQH